MSESTDPETEPTSPPLPSRSPDDLVAGGLFAVVGAAFAFTSIGYDLGSLRELGPGMFPFLIGLCLTGLGIGVAAIGLRSSGQPSGLARLPWRGLLFVLVAVVYFALAIDPLGLIPATAGAALLSCLASPAISVVRALAVTVGITVSCYVIFVVALQLRLPLFP